MDINGPPYDMLPEPGFTVNVGDNRLHVTELPNSFLPHYVSGSRIRLLALLGFTSRTGNIKDVMAAHAIERGLREGRWKKGDEIVVETSGNTGTSFAFRAQEHDMLITTLVSNVVPEGKYRPMRRRGARIITESEVKERLGKTGPNLGHMYAEAIGARVFDQYNDPYNPESYVEVAKQIWLKTGGLLSFASFPLGSTGTLVGMGGYFLQQNRLFRNVHCMPYLGEIIDGTRDPERLKHTGFGWNSYVVKRDGRLDRDVALAKSEKLYAYGIPGGPSSGASLGSACHYLLEMGENGWLEELRGADGWITGLLIFADTRYPYTL